MKNSVFWQRLGSILKVKGVILAPGVYRHHGVGPEVEFDDEILQASYGSLVGTPMWLEHLPPGGDGRQRQPVGFNSGSGHGNQMTHYEGFVYNPEMSQHIEKNPTMPTSLEAHVWGTPTGPNRYKATRFQYRGMVFTMAKPICDKAQNTSVDKIALSTKPDEVTSSMSEEQPNEPSQPDLSEFEAKLSTMTASLEAITAELGRQKQERLSGILSNIREYNPEFKDEEIALGEIESHETKILVATAHLAGLKQKKETLLASTATQSQKDEAPEQPAGTVPEDPKTTPDTIEMANVFCSEAIGISYELAMEKGLLAYEETNPDDLYSLEIPAGDA